MPDILITKAAITGLSHQLHEGKTLFLKPINYLFGQNGSGKSLVLKKITEIAKQEIRSKNLNGDGYFAQYITPSPQASFYQDSFQILEMPASNFDLDNGEISGQAFYQHLEEYPEIKIRVIDALKKYLGRYPNVQRRGINHEFRGCHCEERNDEAISFNKIAALNFISLAMTGSAKLALITS